MRTGAAIRPRTRNNLKEHRLREMRLHHGSLGTPSAHPWQVSRGRRQPLWKEKSLGPLYPILSDWSACIIVQQAARMPPPRSHQPPSFDETAQKLVHLYDYLPLIPFLELEFSKNRTLSVYLSIPCA